jgi:hypothetical protein
MYGVRRNLLPQRESALCRMKYLRFRTTLKEPGISGPLGVFWAAGSLLDSETLDSVSARRLETICQWFNDHLPVPDLEPEH